MHRPVYDKMLERLRSRAAEGEGFFHALTIFAEVDDNSRLAQEEVFGPVMAVIPFDTEDDAVRIANNSNYGLAAGAWTASPDGHCRAVRFPFLAGAT